MTDQVNTDPSKSGLSGLLVLEAVSSPGASFAASLLADFGATVYVCEPPGTGSPLRRLAGADGRWWQVLGRNKRSVAIDATDPAAEDSMRRLLGIADLLIVDAGPLAEDGWRRLAKTVDSPPIVVDLFATGADDPHGWGWSSRAELTSAATGMMALTGLAGDNPVLPEVPIAEYLAGTLAAMRALAALRQRSLNSSGAVDLSIGLHEAVQRMIEWQVPVASALGRAETRNGNSFPMNAGISNMHRTRDGKYVAISAATQATAVRVLEMVGGAELRNHPRFATVAARSNGMKELYALMDKWFEERTLAEALALAEQYGVVAGAIYSVDDILADPHMNARGNIITITGPAGPVSMPNVVPNISGLQHIIGHVGPSLGEHTEEALCKAGIGSASRSAAMGGVTNTADYNRRRK